MPKKSQSKKSHKRKQFQRFALDPPLYHQLAESFVVTPDVNGIGNVVVYWDYFNQLGAYGLLYEYFRPEFYRIVYSEDTTQASCGTLATIPINYKFESIPLSVQISSDYLQQVKGNIYVQQGARNVGQWVKFPNMQSGMNIRDVIPDLGGSQKEAFLGMWSFSLYNQTEAVGSLTIQVRFKIWRRALIPAESATFTFKSSGHLSQVVKQEQPKNKLVDDNLDRPKLMNGLNKRK